MSELNFVIWNETSITILSPAPMTVIPGYQYSASGSLMFLPEYYSSI